jgi:hypothetical protein
MNNNLQISFGIGYSYPQERKHESQKRGSQMKRMIILLMTFVFTLSFNTFVFAKDDSWGNPSICEVAGDILVIRPLGLVRIGIEAVAFVVSLPVTIPLKNVQGATEFLIEDPYDFTFKRPLGKM